MLKKWRFNLLSNPERYIIPDSLIFNSEYHLTKKGVDMRTFLLIEDLKKAKQYLEWLIKEMEDWVMIVTIDIPDKIYIDYLKHVQDKYKLKTPLG